MKKILNKPTDFKNIEEMLTLYFHLSHEEQAEAGRYVYLSAYLAEAILGVDKRTAIYIGGVVNFITETRLASENHVIRFIECLKYDSLTAQHFASTLKMWKSVMINQIIYKEEF